MNAPQGVFDFPGVVSPESGKYLCAHGSDPGRIVLQAAYQTTPVLNVGDLRISYGSQYFDVRDCKVIEQINYYDPSGAWKVEYLLEDRRWKWRFGEIEGHYNRKLASGKIDPQCERTPHEMAELLFRAMKEQRYDYSELPNVARPEVRWVGDNPAQALERLVDILGCRLVYDPVSNTVTVRKTGVGAFLPDLPSVDQSGTNLTKPAIPSGIRVVGRETRIEAAVYLSPVAEDTDGEYVDPINLSYVSDLEADYNTGGNWYYNASPDFEEVTDERQRELLKRSMWKTFKPRLETPIEEEIKQYLQGAGQLQDIEIENLSLTLNREYFDDEDFRKTKQGYVFGHYRTLTDGGPFGVGPGKHANSSTLPAFSKYEGSVGIDNSGDVPIITTGDQLWEWFDNGDGDWIKIKAPDLYLLCTFSVRNRSPRQTCSLHHFNYYYQLTNDTSVGPEVIYEDSLELRPYKEYSLEDGGPIGPLRDNRFDDSLIKRAETVVQNRARKYEAVGAGNATYNELVLARLDGAIQSVSWEFGARGAFTNIYRNSEPDYLETKYDRRVTDKEIARRAGVTR